MVDVQAELASALCEGAFSASEYLSESDARALFFTQHTLAPMSRDFSQYPKTCHMMLANRLRELSDADASALYYGILEKQKIADASKLLPTTPLDDLSKSAISRFLDRVAVDQGFQKKKNNMPPPAQCYVKGGSNSDFGGFFTWDRGGRFDSYQPGFLPVVPALLFNLTPSGQTESSITVSLWEIVSGMSAYTVTLGAIPSSDIHKLASVPESFWITITKLGIVAQIRLFDLFLSSIQDSKPHKI